MKVNRGIKIVVSILIVLAASWYAKYNKSKFEEAGNISGQNAIHTSVNTSNLIYTKHAKCRMECRHVDESEVVEIINAGNVNENKSDKNDSPCPTLAYEGKSHDGQHLRIVVADCEPRDKIVTVIDLENDYKCDCY